MPTLRGVAVVTGAASGIGAATVRAFIRSGVTRLGIADVQAEKLDELKKEFANVDIEAYVCNVSDENDVQKFITGTASKFGRVDYAVNCAGISGKVAATATYATADWDRVIDINQRGLFFCVREQLKVMEKQDPIGSDEDSRRHSRGSIVNISSVAGIVGVGGSPPYVASKHAVSGLSKSVAIDYGGKGIRCNTIAPGYIDTPTIAVTAALGRLPPVPMARAGRPEEIADVAIFLASEGASFVNGATWPVDGGYTAV